MCLSNLNVSVSMSEMFHVCKPFNCDRAGNEDGEGFFLLIIEIAHWADKPLS